MSRAYSEDLRIRLVQLVESGVPIRQAAGILRVGESTSRIWMRKWRNEGNVRPNPVRGHRHSRLEGHAEWLLAYAENHADATLEEMRTQVRDRGVNVSLWAIWYFFRKRGVALKKRHRRRHTQPQKRTACDFDFSDGSPTTAI